MLSKGQPQDLEEMIKFMEQQDSRDSVQKSNSAKSKPQHDGTNKGNKKRKGDFSHNNNSSKKARKHCALCDKDKHGSPMIIPTIVGFTIWMV